MDYFGMLDGPGEPAPGGDELRAIVARAGRYRRRLLAAGVAGALAVGGVVGGVIGNATSDHGKGSVQTASSGSAPASQSAGGVVSSMAPPLGRGSLTALFFRTANGVDIRAYKTVMPEIMPLPSCTNSRIKPAQGLEAELSTSKAIGFADSGFYGLGAPAMTSISVFGTAEGSPTAAVVAQVKPNVALAKMTFTGGAVDQMKPVGGWAVLAGSVPTRMKAAVGVLTTYAADGKQLSSSTVNQPAYAQPGIAVAGPPESVPAGSLPPSPPTTLRVPVPACFGMVPPAGHVGGGSGAVGGSISNG